MDIDGKIADLLALAEPLRVLDDDDPAKGPLGGIVDEINRLRATQEKQVREAPTAVEEGADAEVPDDQPKQRRKPGPKPKKQPDGGDQ